ncbi:hypothetical protein Dsin_016628 [Dipteronia sinensis]|uniref:Uncharacterized protein n=1 Tax=Dipteronia sinensis TaxID=43782 RepID=A0AAE0AET2_9ROSI|nr:hypothetical protein Dsin_016628 [Dipteronia sinensis]
MMGNSNYSLGWPQQLDNTQFLANPTGLQTFRNESNHLSELLPSSKAFHGAGYSAINAVSSDSNQLQSSTALHGAGYLNGSAVTAGSYQRTPSMAIRNTGNVDYNVMSSGSNQFDYEFFYPGDQYDFNTEFVPVMNHIQQGRNTTTTVGRNQVVIGDPAEGSDDCSFSLHDFSDISFPF